MFIIPDIRNDGLGMLTGNPVLLIYLTSSGY